MNKTNEPARFEDLKPFSCLEVRIRERDNFEECVRRFKSVVQKSQVLSLYKQKQAYEKPSDKRRRKLRESKEKARIAEIREQQMISGEWDKKQKAKEQKRREKYLNRKKAEEELSE
jgi:small subunit ribosomal protein S21